jgi:ABC-type transporter Mla subunit MlaD
VELTDALARRPAAGWARAAEAVGAASRNAAHLLNALRPAQARATAAALLRADADRAHAAAEEILAAVSAFDEAVLEAGRRCGGG